jgi:hypothetical protein
LVLHRIITSTHTVHALSLLLQISGKEILTDGGVQVATVLLTPDIEASERLIYLSTPPLLLVNGTNFNVKHTSLFFDPPLAAGEDFTMQVSACTCTHTVVHTLYYMLLHAFSIVHKYALISLRIMGECVTRAVLLVKQHSALLHRNKLALALH